MSLICTNLLRKKRRCRESAIFDVDLKTIRRRFEISLESRAFPKRERERRCWSIDETRGYISSREEMEDRVFLVELWSV